jgi:hypothetical protein
MPVPESPQGMPQHPRPVPALPEHKRHGRLAPLRRREESNTSAKVFEAVDPTGIRLQSFESRRVTCEPSMGRLNTCKLPLTKSDE